jgi:hypothetical protein
MLLFQTPAWWQSPAIWVVGAVVLACGVFLAIWKGYPQQTISSLKDATDAGGRVLTAQEKLLATLQSEKAAAERERDGYRADVERLLREACVRLDIEASDKNTIERLQAELAGMKNAEIELRDKLINVQRQLNERERGGHDIS